MKVAPMAKRTEELLAALPVGRWLNYADLRRVAEALEMPMSSASQRMGHLKRAGYIWERFVRTGTGPRDMRWEWRVTASLRSRPEPTP